MRKSTYPLETESIGGRVRARRMDLGMSIKEVADKVKTKEGVLNEGYLHSIETNRKTPSIEVALELCKVLGIDFKPIRRIILIKMLEPIAAKTKSTINVDFIERAFNDPQGVDKYVEKELKKLKKENDKLDKLDQKRWAEGYKRALEWMEMDIRNHPEDEPIIRAIQKSFKENPPIVKSSYTPPIV